MKIPSRPNSTRRPFNTVADGEGALESWGVEDRLDRLGSPVPTQQPTVSSDHAFSVEALQGRKIPNGRRTFSGTHACVTVSLVYDLSDVLADFRDGLALGTRRRRHSVFRTCRRPFQTSTDSQHFPPALLDRFLPSHPRSYNRFYSRGHSRSL